MTRKTYKGFPGRLGPETVAGLPDDVQRARAEYLTDTSVELSQMFSELGVRENVNDGLAVVSLDDLTERGFQIDTDGYVYGPDDEDDE